MNIEIKKAVKAGNSSAVILPRSWLDREVRVELVKKTPEIILRDVLEISKESIDSGQIIGIYLVGSYARDEETKDSDIDILIVSRDITKKEIKKGIYSILVISLDLLLNKLENNLLPIGPMLYEATPLLNSAYLDLLKDRVKITKKNVKWYINTTKEKLNIIREVLTENQERIDNRTIYTLVLRIRTLKIIEELIKNKSYSKRDFVKLIAKISGSNNAYESYLSQKNNLINPNLTTKEEAEKLYNYLKKQLDYVKRIL